MKKDFILLMSSILSLWLVTSVMPAPDCSYLPLYEPMENPDADPPLSNYFICLSTAASASIIMCPSGLRYNAATKGCAYPKEELPPKDLACTTPGETLMTDTDTCSSYKMCNEYLEPIDSTCYEPYEVFNHLLGRCVPKSAWTCGETKPDCDVGEYGDKFYPVPNDCRSYYQCVNTVRIKGKCPTNTYFDFTTQICETGWHCEEVSGGSVSMYNICKGNANKFIADPKYCMGFYYCVDENTPYWGYCSDAYFTDGYCLDNRPITCTCEGFTPPTGIAYVASAMNRTDYFVCEEGKAPSKRTCPAGFIFDAIEVACVRY